MNLFKISTSIIILLLHLLFFCQSEKTGLIPYSGKVLFEENFENAALWHHEGIGRFFLPEPGVMKIECIGGQQGGYGAQAICRNDFPDSISIEFDMNVLTQNGLIIIFVAMSGIDGEDIITNLPARKGLFSEYTGENAKICSYHVSVSRYNDDGEHTGVSNWRRNPGLHLMGQGPDLCKNNEQWYHIRIVKKGLHLQLGVNDKLAHEFFDPDTLVTPIPRDGKIGFRAIGKNVQVLIKNFRVVSIR